MNTAEVQTDKILENYELHLKGKRREQPKLFYSYGKHQEASPTPPPPRNCPLVDQDVLTVEVS
jgi:hypothetical protein